jgi:hypothetical protein
MPDEDHDAPDEGVAEHILDPTKVRLWRTEAGKIRMEIEGDRSVLHVNIARAFPVSHPEHYIGFRDEDDKDVGMVVEPGKLDPKTRKIVDEQLRKRYFVPVITRIHSIKEEYGVGHWIVETDRGHREFVVRGMRDSIWEVGEQRLIIIDADNNRYDIPDYTELDYRSYRLIEETL